MSVSQNTAADSRKGARNSALDLAKGIACICVVFMHCEFPGKLGILVQCVSRFCVPLFFMVSGYFCFSEKGKSDYSHKLRHIGRITLIAVLFYAIVTPIYAGLPQGLTVKKLLQWLLLNQPFYIASQLWFLFALLYDYLAFSLVDRYRLHKAAFLAIPVLIVVYVILAQGMRLCGVSVPNPVYRNWLIEGFPLFTLGYYLHREQDRIRISDRLLLVVLILTTVLCPVERLLMGRDFGVNIVTFPQTVSLFLLCLKHPEGGREGLLSTLGRDGSLYVYILHPAIWHFLDMLYAALGLAGNTAALYLRPVLCALFSMAAAFLIIKLKNRRAVSGK